jgi:hypothetical protein
MLKKIVKKITTPDFRKKIMEIKSLFGWLLKGAISPAPHIVKRNILRKYARRYGCKVFIETGTYLGDTVFSLKNDFDKIISIELGQNLYEQAKKRFADYPQIKIMRGDSGQVLTEIVPNLSEPTLFWLDGHYSGKGTAKSNLNTPIIKELETIFNHPVKNHVILIDDARCFTGDNDYPSIEFLKNFINKKRPETKIQVKNDIIRIWNLS